MSIEIIIKHEEKPVRVFESIPLTESVLCVDCDCVMRLDKNGRCSVCGSDSVLPLWGAMNRPAPESDTSSSAVPAGYSPGRAG